MNSDRMDIRTQGLTEFASDPKVDLDVDSIQGLAAAAGQSSSVMEEGIAFHQAHQAAVSQVMKHLGTVKHGNETYRSGAAKMAGIHQDGEEAARQTMESTRPTTTFGPTVQA